MSHGMNIKIYQVVYYLDYYYKVVGTYLGCVDKISKLAIAFTPHGGKTK